MHREEPTLVASDLAGYPGPTLVMVGDRDEMSLEHTIALYRGLADAQLAVLPGRGHGDIDLRAVARFLWTPARLFARESDGRDRGARPRR